MWCYATDYLAKNTSFSQLGKTYTCQCAALQTDLNGLVTEQLREDFLLIYREIGMAVAARAG